MEQNRRHFLKLALSGAVCIHASGLHVFAANGFVLPAKDDLKLRVAIASDGHYGQPETDFAEAHAEMVSWINKERGGRGVDFAFVNGDLFHNDTSFLEPVKKLWDTLEMPYHVSHGNHDMISENDWQKTWGDNWHYGFDKNEVGFVVLNTADDKGTYVSPDVEKTKQLLSQYNHYKQLFVFMHITPYKWTKGGIDCPEIVSLFHNQNNLKAVFHGHDHDMDNVKSDKGIHYFFDSHICGNWGTNYRGYRILEIFKNGNIITYQMNPADKEQVNNLSIK